MIKVKKIAEPFIAQGDVTEGYFIDFLDISKMSLMKDPKRWSFWKKGRGHE